jgi:hypothetical protein
VSKVIRPLASYKKLNPELYLSLWKLITATSKKSQENEFYFLYAYSYLGVETFKEILDPAQIKIIENIKKKENLTKDEIQKQIERIKKGTYHLTKHEFNSFYFNSKEEFTNIGTVSEIGRLLLYGWYYNIESWSIEIGGYIYNAYKKIESSGETFNDLDFKKAVKHIRENIIYYYQNEPELKLYILETFFNNKLQELLPEKPKELKEHDNAIEFLERLRIVQTKKGIDYWINRAEDFETYIYYLNSYLEETYENYNFEFLNFEDWKKENKQYDNEYFNRVDKLDKNYKASYKDIIKKINLPKEIGYNK